MAQQVTDMITAKTRTPGGKGTARKLRNSGWIPAVAYGPSQEPIHLSIIEKDLILSRQTFGMAHIYEINIDGGKPRKVLLKEITRNAVSRKLTHVDFYVIDTAKVIRVRARLETVGKAKGLIEGGILQQLQRRVEIQCLPHFIPDHLTIDVSDLDIGDSLHLSDLKLPEGVTVTALANEALVVMAAPSAAEVKTTVGAEETDAEQPAEEAKS